MIKPKAIIVCVDYWDLLALTVPRNRRYFEEVWVVTSPQDGRTQNLALNLGLELVVTNLFYKEGATFNKWGALEFGLDMMGREGWICVMDADIVWPRSIPNRFWDSLEIGNLYTPYRRMCPLSLLIPEEYRWTVDYPRHRNVGEWAGYSQLFHASDPVLETRPWFEEWTHAGGADSFFQRRWPKTKKIRPDWECLHIGPAGKNWAGRTTTMLDGTEPPNKGEKEEYFRRLLAHRSKHRGDYSGEKLSSGES